MNTSNYQVKIAREHFQQHGDCWVARDEQADWRCYAQASFADNPVAAAKAMFHAGEIVKVIDHGKFAIAVIATN